MDNSEETKYASPLVQSPGRGTGDNALLMEAITTSQMDLSSLIKHPLTRIIQLLPSILQLATTTNPRGPFQLKSKEKRQIYPPQLSDLEQIYPR